MIVMPRFVSVNANYALLAKKCVVCTLLGKRQRSAFKGKKQKQADKVHWQYLNLPDKDNPEFEEGEFLPRRLTYMPPGLKFGLKKKRYRKIKELITLKPQIDDKPEWTETPCYPPLFDDSKSDSENMRKRLLWYDEIKQLPSAELKLLEISDFVQHRSIILGSWAANYDYLTMYQDLTRTHLFRQQLPEEYDTINVDRFVERLKLPILDAIRCHCYDSKRMVFKEHRMLPVPLQVSENESAVTNLLQEINSICQKVLGPESNHLLDAQVDYKSDVRSWWWKNVPPPTRRNYFKLDKLPNVNQAMQFYGSAAVQLRTDNPLPPILPLGETLNARGETVPTFPSNPAKNGWHMRQIFLQTVPGFWSLSNEYKYDFPYMAFLSRTPVKQREVAVGRTYPDLADFIDAMGVMHGFGWLNAVSAIHGFTPYQELTYPFTTHLTITDGQFWSFFVYQMNTHSFHSDIDTKERINFCWSSGEMKLFDKYENGEFQGLNDDVIKNLAKLLTRTPQPFENTVLKPYLSEDNRSEEEILDTRKRLRRRMGQALNAQERYIKKVNKVFPFEWVFVRHPKAPPTVNWRLPRKIPIKFPDHHFTRLN